jgi:CBS domain-containing protein
MGEQKVKVVRDQKQMQHFVKQLLRDIEAFDYMLKNDWFEKDITRIGAEQEMCLVDKDTYKPALINMEALERMKDWDWVGTELAKFNLETNMTPLEFKGDCLSAMEKENNDGLQKIRGVLKEFNAEVVLTGILPTLRKFDLNLENLTPKPRYYALIESIKEHSLRGDSHFELRLDGIDELHILHDSPLLEACNTSFQIHLQVSPEEFVSYYNIAQTLAAPMVSIAANSPMVFGRRLWHETRIALFQQALDTRTSHDHLRERRPRVNFGSDWLHESILEIHKEDIARFRVLLGDIVEEDSLATVMKGGTPKLRALQIHNSTVYRWNRPCYGISPNGKPHLRIENRVLPAGPSVLDATANAAFWLGLMVGMKNRMDNGHWTLDSGKSSSPTSNVHSPKSKVQDFIGFEDIRDNFDKAAKFGFDTTYTWFNDKKIAPRELILEELLPMAREGLKAQNVDENDIEKYLGVIEQRAKLHMTGARWQLRSFTKLIKEVSVDEALTVMTAAIVKNQWDNKPVHTWELPKVEALESYRPAQLRVEEFMQTDLFTAQKDDIIELVAKLMDWRKIRYMPVEDAKGKLVGLVSSRLLLRHFTKVSSQWSGSSEPTNHKPIVHNRNIATVKDVMIENPITIRPEATLQEALDTMREKKIGCLPVVNTESELIGVITEMDFLRITDRLMKKE